MPPYSPISRKDDTSFMTSAQRGSTREPALRRARLSRREPNWRLSFSSSIREYSRTMSLYCSLVSLANLYLVGYLDRRVSKSQPIRWRYEWTPWGVTLTLVALSMLPRVSFSRGPLYTRLESSLREVRGSPRRAR